MREILANMAIRFPRGIVTVLADVLGALDAEADADDAATLEELVLDELSEQRINPESRRCPREKTRR